MSADSRCRGVVKSRVRFRDFLPVAAVEITAVLASITSPARSGGESRSGELGARDTVQGAELRGPVVSPARAGRACEVFRLVGVCNDDGFDLPWEPVVSSARAERVPGP